MSETQIWKTKFIEINKKYHEAEEKLLVLEAENQNLKLTRGPTRDSGVRSSMTTTTTTKTSTNNAPS